MKERASTKATKRVPLGPKFRTQFENVLKRWLLTLLSQSNATILASSNQAAWSILGLWVRRRRPNSFGKGHCIRFVAVSGGEGP